MTFRNQIHNHLFTEAIELSESSSWMNGEDIPFDSLNKIESYLEEEVKKEREKPEDPAVASFPQQDESGFMNLPYFSSVNEIEDEEELASREEVLLMMEEVYDAFEEIFEVEIPDEARTRMKNNNIYDESHLFTFKNSLKNSKFINSIAASGALTTIGLGLNSWMAFEMSDRVLENTGDFTKSSEVVNQILGMNDDIAVALMGAGALYGLKNAYQDTKQSYEGKHKSSVPPLIDSLGVGGRDYRICITPDRTTHDSALYTGVAENLHRLQQDTGSSTYGDPLLWEGMEIFAKYLVAEKFEEEGILDHIDHSKKKRDFKYKSLIEAYGILKNNGGYLTDEKTFIDAGMDPEESLRAKRYVEHHVGRYDRSRDQLFGYSVGAAYLIMEYENEDLDPGEVLRDGREALSEEFNEVYNMPFMENI